MHKQPGIDADRIDGGGAGSAEGIVRSPKTEHGLSEQVGIVLLTAEGCSTLGPKTRAIPGTSGIARCGSRAAEGAGDETRIEQ